MRKGRPAHEPTDKNKTIVNSLASYGIPHEDIASKLNISADTLVKYYKKELDDGRIDANAEVAKTLMQQIRKGNTLASIFYLKTRAGWKETSKHEITGDNGKPVKINVTFKKKDK
tara:strand:+ start:4086 stop:4430 length:345 start_codon:yes stop_codon:yes gene_type:complete